MVPMMMMVVAARNRLGQVLNVGKLPALRGVGEVRGQLVELGGGRRVAVRGSGLGGVLQVGRDLPGDLLVFGRVRLLKPLQRTQQLGKGRKLVGILRIPERDAAAAAGAPAGGTGAAQCGGEQGLEVSTVGSRKGVDVHGELRGSLQSIRITFQIKRLKSTAGVRSLAGGIFLANGGPVGPASRPAVDR